MEGFWGLLYENYAVSMISYDLSIAALTFLIYIIYTYWSNPKKIFKYLEIFFEYF